MKNTYTPLNKQGFQAATVAAKTKAKNYVEAVQELALSCIYFARSNNDSRKADMVYSLLDKAHQRKLVDFITNHSDLVFVTAKHRSDYKKKTGKTWDTSRHFYLSRTVNSGDESVRLAALEFVASIEPILWTEYKAPKNTDIKPYDTVNSLTRLLKRVESAVYEPANELEAKQMKALETFMSAIEAGLTLDDIVTKARKSPEIIVPATIAPELLEELEKTA